MNFIDAYLLVTTLWGDISCVQVKIGIDRCEVSERRKRFYTLICRMKMIYLNITEL